MPACHQRHILGLHNCLLERQEAQRVEEETAGLLDEISTWKDVPEHIRVELVCTHSDLEPAEVVKCISKVPKSDIHMLVYQTGIGEHVKFPPEARNLTVLHNIVRLKNAEMGKRMIHFKRDGGIRASGKPDYKDCCYTATYSSDGAKQLVKLKHNSMDDEVEAPQWAFNITADVGWGIRDNFDDWSAVFVVQDGPRPVPLRDLFDKDKKGPWKVPIVRGGKKVHEFHALFKKEEQANTAACKALAEQQAEQQVVPDEADTAETKKKLEDMRKTKHQQQTSSSKAKALETLKRNADNRCVKLTRQDSVASGDQ